MKKAEASTYLACCLVFYSFACMSTLLPGYLRYQTVSAKVLMTIDTTPKAAQLSMECF